MTESLDSEAAPGSPTDAPAPPRPPCVLVAEDDQAMRNLLVEQLRKRGYDVIEAANGIEVLEILTKSLPGENAIDLIVSDIRMPGVTGLEILAGLRSSQWSTRVILITAFGDARTHAEAARLGVLRVFDKPFKMADLITTVAGVLPPPA